MAKKRFELVALSLLLGAVAYYYLFIGKATRDQGEEISPVTSIEVDLDKSPSTQEAPVPETPPLNLENELDAPLTSASNDEEKLNQVGRSSDKFADWFEGFEYTPEQEGESAAKVLDWSLNGPPGPTPNTDKLVKMWESQKYDELNAFADERLRKNSTDLVGLLLRMEDAALNRSVEQYYERCAAVLESIKNSDTGNFSEMCAILVRQIRGSLDSMETRSPEELEKARESIRTFIRDGRRERKTFHMRVESYIKALEIDGYWGKEQ